jgi:hypothetical protein
MNSWRDTASPQAQADLDGLLNAALGFAQHQLAERGEFFPYATVVRTDGEAEMIAASPNPANDRPASSDVISSSVAQLISRRHQLRAAAVVADVSAPELGGDAIEVSLEHAEGPALRVLLPYTKRRFRKGIEYGQVRAESGARRIWSDA